MFHTRSDLTANQVLNIRGSGPRQRRDFAFVMCFVSEKDILCRWCQTFILIKGKSYLRLLHFKICYTIVTPTFIKTRIALCSVMCKLYFGQQNYSRCSEKTNTYYYFECCVLCIIRLPTPFVIILQPTKTIA